MIGLMALWLASLSLCALSGAIALSYWEAR
jgi:hypothetical protein